MKTCGDLSADTPSAMVAPDGAVCFNPLKEYQTWIWFRGLGPQKDPAPTIPAGASITVSYPVSPDGVLGGDAEFCYLLGGPFSERFSVLLTDSRTKRQYMNTPVSSAFVYGLLGFLPGSFADSIYVPANTGLTAQFTNLGSLAITGVKTSAYGRRFVGRESLKLQAKREASFFSSRVQPYWMSSDLGPETRIAAAGGTATIRMTVPSSAHFEALALLDDSDDDFEFVILDGATNRAFMDGPIPRNQGFSLTAGGNTAIGAASLRRCRWTNNFNPSAQITFQITNLGSGANTIRIGILGRVLYVTDGRSLEQPGGLGLNAIPLTPGPYASPAVDGWCSPAPDQAPGGGRLGPATPRPQRVRFDQFTGEALPSDGQQARGGPSNDGRPGRGRRRS